MTIHNLKDYRHKEEQLTKKVIAPLSNIEKFKIDNSISKDKSILRLNYIHMAVDPKLQLDYIHNRYIHSMQVANIIEIICIYLSESLGFDIDPRGIYKYAGVFHDIGHTAFGHQGEYELNRYLRSKNISYDGNANNYVALKRSGVLNIFTKKDREYILASLAKHFQDLYPEQFKEKKIIFEEIIKDEIFLKDNGINTTLTKTLACMIMDIADEIAYLITDIMDAMNIVSIEMMKKGIIKYCSKDVQNKLLPALKTGKSKFREALDSYTIVFAANLKLENGKITHISEEIEDIRKAFRKINVNMVIKSKEVRKLQEENEKLFQTVFKFFIENEYDISDIPSSYYREKLVKEISEDQRLILVRDMLGGLTDKGLIDLYKKINLINKGKI